MNVPDDIWREIHDFFARIVTPCKDCVRGNLHQCFESRCPAFLFRAIFRRISSVGGRSASRASRSVQSWVIVENDILSALKSAKSMRLRPRDIRINSTCSKANKHSAIKRLLRSKRIVQTFINGVRYISLPTTTTEKTK